MADLDLHSASGSESSRSTKAPRKKKARKSKKEEIPLDAKVTYDTDGKYSEVRFTKSGTLHNEEGPAITKITPEGKPSLRQFYIDGKFLGEIFFDKYGIPHVKMIKGLHGFPAPKAYKKYHNLWTGYKTYEDVGGIRIVDYIISPIVNLGPYEVTKILTRIPK
jgi:hypothetical protein